MHGYGTYIWPDGRKFIGMYLNGKKNGEGEYRTKSGVKLKGNWRNGKKDGLGNLILLDGTI